MTFYSHRPAKAWILLGIPFTVLAILPWLGTGSLPWRLAASAAFTAFSLALFRMGWPRLWRATLDVDAERVLVSGTTVAFSSVDRIYLTARSGVHSGEPWPTYAVEIGSRDGRRFPLIETRDPAAALAALRSVHATLSVPVSASGWGLDPSTSQALLDALRGSTPRATSAKEAAKRFEALVKPSQPATVLTVATATLLTGALMAIFFWTRSQKGLPTATMSYWLSGLTLAFMACVALAVYLRRVVFRFNRVLRVERLGLTGRRVLLEVPLEAVLWGSALCPGTGEPRHVAILTSEGPAAFECTGRAAVEVSERLPPKHSLVDA